MKFSSLFAALLLLCFTSIAQEADSTSIEINMNPFGETPKTEAVLLDSTIKARYPEPSRWIQLRSTTLKRSRRKRSVKVTKSARLKSLRKKSQIPWSSITTISL